MRNGKYEIMFGQVVWRLELTQFTCREVECPSFEPRPLHIMLGNMASMDEGEKSFESVLLTLKSNVTND